MLVKMTRTEKLKRSNMNIFALTLQKIDTVYRYFSCVSRVFHWHSTGVLLVFQGFFTGVSLFHWYFTHSRSVSRYTLLTKHDTFQSFCECRKNAVRMPSECHQNVVGMPSECRQNAVRMPSECHQNAVRMSLECR